MNYSLIRAVEARDRARSGDRDGPRPIPIPARDAACPERAETKLPLLARAARQAGYGFILLGAAMAVLPIVIVLIGVVLVAPSVVITFKSKFFVRVKVNAEKWLRRS